VGRSTARFSQIEFFFSEHELSTVLFIHNLSCAHCTTIPVRDFDFSFTKAQNPWIRCMQWVFFFGPVSQLFQRLILFDFTFCSSNSLRLPIAVQLARSSGRARVQRLHVDPQQSRKSICFLPSSLFHPLVYYVFTAESRTISY
jgi:hypothetical protein